MAARGGPALSRDRNSSLPSPPLTLIGLVAGSVGGLLGVMLNSRLLRLGFLAPVGYLL